MTATVKRINAINGWLLGLCCLVCLAAIVESTSTPTGMSKDAAAAAHKGLYKTKRQDKYQQQQQRGIAANAMAAIQPGSIQQRQPLTKSAHGLNKKLLSKMGFMKVKAPNSHNRKRLAVESRRHASRDDSHMFIIKLPPNLHYYTAPNPVKNVVDHQQQQLQQQQPQQQQHQSPATATATATATAAITQTTTEASVLKTNGKKVSFPFSSNGRPGRIYHWNLPVLKQALHKQKQKQNAHINHGYDHHHPHHVSSADRNRLLDIEKQPTWRKPWENETIEKSFNPTSSGGKSKYKKSLKPKSPTYYAPAQAVSKQSFHKYFAGNGKPKGFYVIKEHQTKPQFYQNIIS